MPGDGRRTRRRPAGAGQARRSPQDGAAGMFANLTATYGVICA